VRNNWFKMVFPEGTDSSSLSDMEKFADTPKSEDYNSDDHGPLWLPSDYDKPDD